MLEVEDTLNSRLGQKAFTVSYAIFRLTPLARQTHASLADFLEYQALAMLRAVSEGNGARARRACQLIERYVKLGVEARCIRLDNGNVVAQEATRLAESISVLEKEQSQKFNVAELFPEGRNLVDQPVGIRRNSGETEVLFSSPLSDEFTYGYSVKDSKVRMAEDIFRKDTRNPTTPANAATDIAVNAAVPEIAASYVFREESLLGSVDKKFTDISKKETKVDNAAKPEAASASSTRSSTVSTQRKKKVLQLMRQLGKCRIKDIQELFPDLSDRALRYDLGDLINDGRVVRFGPGGPQSYYTLKNNPAIDRISGKIA